MPKRIVYEFGAFRFDAAQCLLTRLSKRPIKILKQKEKNEAELGTSRCALLLAFLKAAVENEGADVTLAEQDLIKTVWPKPNADAETAKSTLKRTIGDLKKILKDNDPRERDYIRHAGGWYTFTFPVKRRPSAKAGNSDDLGVGDPGAKQHYAWGRHHLDMFTTEDRLQKVIEEFQKAYEIVPDFAAAYAHEALAHLWLSIFSWRSPKDTLPEAQRASALALHWEKSLGVAHTAKAFTVLFTEPDPSKRWKVAELHFEKAIELDKKHDQKFEAVYQMDALRRLARKQLREAELSLVRSLEINPVSFVSNFLKALARFVSRNYESCHESLQEILSQEANIDAAYYIRVLVCIYRGEPDKARDEIERGERMAEGNILYRLLLAYWYAIWGSEDEAIQCIEELDEESERRYISPYHRALPYVHIDKHRAVERLESAALEGDPWVLLLKVDPRVDPLRREERFITLLQRLGLDFS